MAAIQVKNVPRELHDKLRERAGGESMTLAAYILSVLEREVAKPQTLDEWMLDRSFNGSVKGVDIAALIREGRDERTAEIERRVGDRLLGRRRASDE